MIRLSIEVAVNNVYTNGVYTNGQNQRQSRATARQRLLTIVSYAFPPPSQLVLFSGSRDMPSQRSKDELTEKALLALIFVLILLAIALHLKI
jgi:hypothetical protein